MSQRWTADDLVICDLGALEDIAGKVWKTWWFGVILLRCSAWLVIGLYFDIFSASGVVILLMAPWFLQDCSYNLFLYYDLSMDEHWLHHISPVSGWHSVIFAISSHYQIAMLSLENSSKSLLQSVTDPHDQGKWAHQTITSERIHLTFCANVVHSISAEKPPTIQFKQVLNSLE